MSSKDNSKIIKNGKDPKTSPTNTTKKGQQYIKTVLIPKETILVKEDRFATAHFVIQTSLAILGLCTLAGFIYYSSLQHADSLKNIKLQERFAKIEARAYIRYDSIFTDFAHIKRTAWVSSHIINCGKTPAFNTRTFAKRKFMEKEITDKDWDVIKIHERDTGKTLAPGESVEIRANGDSARTKADSINEANTVAKTDLEGSRVAFYIYGITWYDDAFGTHHWIRYCRGYKIWNKNWQYISPYNDCDNNE